MSIDNEGRISARRPYLGVGPERGSAWAELEPFSGRATHTRRFFEASELSLHPELVVDAAKLMFMARKERGGEAIFHYRSYGDMQKCIESDIKVECKIGCEDTPSRRVGLVLPAGVFEYAIDLVLSGRKLVEVDAKYLVHLA
jgi:hypothetical protein